MIFWLLGREYSNTICSKSNKVMARWMKLITPFKVTQYKLWLNVKAGRTDQLKRKFQEIPVKKSHRMNKHC